MCGNPMLDLSNLVLFHSGQVRHLGVKNVYVQHPKCMRKYISKLHKIKGAHLQYVRCMQGLNKKE